MRDTWWNQIDKQVIKLTYILLNKLALIRQQISRENGIHPSLLCHHTFLSINARLFSLLTNASIRSLREPLGRPHLGGRPTIDFVCRAIFELSVNSVRHWLCVSFISSAFVANKKGGTVSTSPGGRISPVISSDLFSLSLCKQHAVR